MYNAHIKGALDHHLASGNRPMAISCFIVLFPKRGWRWSPLFMTPAQFAWVGE